MSKAVFWYPDLSLPKLDQRHEISTIHGVLCLPNAISGSAEDNGTIHNLLTDITIKCLVHS
jgi:hypothetical protein